MSSEIMRQILHTVEAELELRPAPIAFELAYQARVAMDRIRFAIKHVEQCPHTDQMREAAFQLLEALERLEMADRRFQDHSRIRSVRRSGGVNADRELVDGKACKPSRARTNSQ
jgi:hypothetical protein